ncbi:hypothetical protein Tco_1420764 [Tanacetum coccineum]
MQRSISKDILPQTVVFVPLATPVLGALSPDDSAEESYEAYTEPDVDSDVQADIDADNAAAEAAAAREADARVEVDTRIDREGEEDEEAKSSHRGTVKIGVDTVVEPVVLKDTLVPTDDEDSREVVQLGLDEIVQELHDHLEEIHIWRIRVIESVHRDQGHKMLVASQQSVVISDRIRVLERDNMRLRAITMPTATCTGMIPAVIEEMIEQCMEEALEAYRNRVPTRKNRDEHGDDNGNGNEIGNGDGGENGNGNGLGGGNGNGNPNVNV